MNKNQNTAADYLIVGNGAAAAGVIEGIRSVDEKGSILCISKENHAVYSRPLISYYLEGKTELSRMNYRSADFYEKNHCTVLYGVSAEKLDAEQHKVLLSDGFSVSFGKLCVADGSRPFVPPFEGLEKVKNKFGFLTLDDTLLLEKSLDREAKVLIMGAGLIGLKCAEGIKVRVGSVTVADLAETVLSSILDTDVAVIVQKHLEENGIHFLLGDTALSFDENEAHMKSGKTVPFDLLVLAVGVRPNTALVAEAGGVVNRGIHVDEAMRTSLPDVFSAGDCAEYRDISACADRIMAIMPNAFLGGECAGVNMAGGEKTFSNAIPMNAIGFFGLHMLTAGSYTGECYEEKNEKSIKKLYYADGVLKGFILLGDVDKAGIYTSLIRNRTPLDSIDFELVKQKPTLIAFGKEDRQKKLGGVV